MEPKTKKIIIIISVILVVLILGLIITKHFFVRSTSNINSINNELLNKMSNLIEQDEKLVIALGNQNTATVKKGTDGFGVPIGFAPDNSSAWGTSKKGCKYNIKAELDECINCCINQGWNNPENDIYPGTRNMLFDQIQDGKGYALIKINIPKDIEPCIQSFAVTVNCDTYPNETVTNYFGIQVIK